MHGFSQKELTEGLRALEIGGLVESVSSIEQARSRRSHLHEQGADRAADQFVKTMEDCHKKITQARRKLEKEKPDIAKELQNLDKNWLTKAFMNMTRVARGKKPAVKPGRKAYEAVDDSETYRKHKITKEPDSQSGDWVIRIEGPNLKDEKSVARVSQKTNAYAKTRIDQAIRDEFKDKVEDFMEKLEKELGWKFKVPWDGYGIEGRDLKVLITGKYVGDDEVESLLKKHKFKPQKGGKIWVQKNFVPY